VKNYQVTITETLKRTITVEAEDAAAAEEMVEEQCNNGEIDLTVENDWKSRTVVAEELSSIAQCPDQSAFDKSYELRRLFK
jgi:hypothetical protein